MLWYANVLNEPLTTIEWYRISFNRSTMVVVRGKVVPEKNGPRKIGPRKIDPRENDLQKLFSVKRMLGNLNDFFIFIDWFHYTHKKMFDVYVTILHMHQESRKDCCRVLGFHRLITFEHSTHTRHDTRRSPHGFLFLSFPGADFPGTNFAGTIFPRFMVVNDHFIREGNLWQLSP